MDPSPSFVERLTRKLIPYSWAIIAFFAVLTYFAYPRAIGLMGNIKTELSHLLPDHFTSIKAAKDIKNAFQKSGGGDLVFIYQTEGPQPDTVFLKALVDHVEAMPEVESVDYTKTGYDFFEKNKLLFISLEDLHEIRDRISRKIQEEKLGGLFIDLGDSDEKAGKKDPFDFDDLIKKYQTDYKREVDSPYLSNPERTAFAFWIYPKNKSSSLKFFKTFYKRVDAHMKTFPWEKYPQAKTYFAGSIKTRIDEYDSLMGDLKRAGVISGIGIFLILILYFRRLSSPILLFIPLSSGILLGFALCSFFIDNLNLVTSFLFSILFGMGVDVGIHMFARYIEDRQSGLSIEDSIVNVVGRSGRSSTVAVITTCASFFILILNDFRGFSEFGWIAGIGLLVTLIVYLLFFPAILVVADRLRIVRFHTKRHDAMNRLLERIPAFPHAKKVVIAGAAFTIASLVAVPFVQFEWNYGVLRSQIAVTEEAKAILKTISPRVNRPASILIQSEEEAAVLKKAYGQRKAEDTETPTIEYFRSSYDLFPRDQEERMQMLRDIGRLLDDDAMNVLKDDQKQMIADFQATLRQTHPFTKKDIPQELIQRYLGPKGDGKYQLGLVYPKPDMELGDGRNAIEFYKDVHRVEGGDRTYYAVSDAIVFADVLKTTFRDARKAILLSMLALVILIYLDFRTVKESLLVFGALCAGIFWMVGIMVPFGLKFNFYNMVTIPMMIGMGEDNSVHVVHRFDEYGRKSVMRALWTSGGSACMASLTTMFGYLGLVFTHHPGLRSIGILAVIGVTTCMLASLVLLPAIMEVYWRKKEPARQSS